ncbi:unnamed protein product [Vitrella brassicaformis CCMP3155]|uniref:Uncharacterized protein n=2 Tax=Vitrella brassicaformis TaxID=1169539 RepID=A0A0G4EBT3_VITBC|nr:unnamed protein product [Vitrella brassicaformis CCMP3155]|eukprot:CEL92757.1 unnamed protein product [Vitrella brassicaformis CCMP3155]
MDPIEDKSIIWPQPYKPALRGLPAAAAPHPEAAPHPGHQPNVEDQFIIEIEDDDVGEQQQHHDDAHAANAAAGAAAQREEDQGQREQQDYQRAGAAGEFEDSEKTESQSQGSGEMERIGRGKGEDKGAVSMSESEGQEEDSESDGDDGADEYIDEQNFDEEDVPRPDDTPKRRLFVPEMKDVPPLTDEAYGALPQLLDRLNESLVAEYLMGKDTLAPPLPTRQHTTGIKWKPRQTAFGKPRNPGSWAWSLPKSLRAEREPTNTLKERGTVKVKCRTAEAIREGLRLAVKRRDEMLERHKQRKQQQQQQMKEEVKQEIKREREREEGSSRDSAPAAAAAAGDGGRANKRRRQDEDEVGETGMESD